MSRKMMLIAAGTVAVAAFATLVASPSVRSGDYRSSSAMGAALTRSVAKLAEEYHVQRQIAYYRYQARWDELADEIDDDDEDERRRRDARAYAMEIKRLKDRFTRHIQELADEEAGVVLIAVLGRRPGGGVSAVLRSRDFGALSPIRDGIRYGEVTEGVGTLAGQPVRQYVCPVNDLFQGGGAKHPEKWQVHLLLRGR